METDPERQEEPAAEDADAMDDGRTPPPDDLDRDPAHNPEDEGVREIKGG